MSTICEVPFEPLALDGSNYDSWSSNFPHTLKDIGPIAESIVVTSILPKDWTYVSLEDLEHTQLMPLLLNFCVGLFVKTCRSSS